MAAGSARQGSSAKHHMPHPRSPRPPLSLLLLLLLLLPPSLFALSSAAPPLLSSYSSSVELDPGIAYFYWTYSQAQESLSMAVHAKTTGWVGLGISEVGAMVGSDVWLGWVANGSAVMTDRFIFNKSLDASGVALDSSQDVKILAGQESYNSTDGYTWTTLHFSRLLNTSDCNDRVIQAGEHVSLIFAMGSTDEAAYHGKSRGGTTLVLVPGGQFSIAGRQVPGLGTGSVGASTVKVRSGLEVHQGPTRRLLGQRKAVGRALQVLPPSTTNPGTKIEAEDFLNLTMTNFMVSSNYTTYVCNAFDIEYTEKKHGMEFGVIVNTTHPEALHHIVIWACSGSDQPGNTSNYLCFNSGGCSQYLAIWALGGQAVKIPEAAGMPIGPGGFTKLVLQIHYTNPEARSDIVDSSGMYVKLAPQLRKYDTGVMELGPAYFTAFINIPAHTPVWTQDTVCPAACTDRLANASQGLGTNITVFANMQHQHTTGKQLYTELYRDNKKLFTVGRQDYYDFAFQQFKDLSPGFFVLPGDELRTRCVWDTTNRTNATLGGFDSNLEMCMSYAMYYPLRSDFVSACFTGCTPTKQGIAPLLFCAADVIPYPNLTCSQNDSLRYGAADVPFETIAGCTADLLPSLDAAALAAVSVAATPGTPAPATSSCTAPGPNGVTLAFTQCTALDGGFNLMWNFVPSEGAGAQTASKSSDAGGNGSRNGNVTVVMRFSGTSKGYIALGFSPTGGMLGSSAIAGWVGSAGPMVEPLFLGGYAPSLLAKGNALQVLGTSLESTPSTSQPGQSDLVMYANISMPISQATASQNVIWSKGPVLNNFLSQHEATDAHKGTLLAVDCSSSAADCGALGLLPPPSSSDSPPPSASAAGGGPKALGVGRAVSAAVGLALGLVLLL